MDSSFRKKSTRVHFFPPVYWVKHEVSLFKASMYTCTFKKIYLAKKEMAKLTKNLAAELFPIYSSQTQREKPEK